MAFVQMTKAQTLEHAISEIRNENLISAKKELLKVVPQDEIGTSLFYLANVYLRLENKDSALYYFNQTAARNDAYAAIAKIRVAMLKGSDTSAFRENIEKAITLSKKKNAEVFFQIGMLAFRPEPTEVSKYLYYMQRAIELDPNTKYYSLMLGDMYYSIQRGGEALRSYETVLSADQNNVLANIRLGRLYYAAQNYDLAISYYEKANSIDPSYSIAHKELGELYYRTRKYDKASQEYKTYISLNDNDKKIKEAYSGFLYQLKEYERAINEINGFISTDTNNFVYYKILAYCYLDSKNPKDAQTVMSKFWSKVPADKVQGLDYTYAGKIANANGDTANAVKYMRKAVEMDTANADILSEYSVILYNTKRYNEAISSLNKRVSMTKPATNLDYYYLGRAYYNCNQWVLADSAFSNLIKIQNNWADAYLWRARCNYELEQPKIKGLAYVYYQKYAELASVNPEKYKSNLETAYFYMGIVNLLNNDKESAKTNFNKVLEINPNNKGAKEELAKLK